MRLVLKFVLVAAVSSTALRGNAAAKLLYTVKDRTYEVAGYAEAHPCAIVDGARVQLPEGGKIELGGEWEADDEHLLFSPSTTIVRKAYPDWVPPLKAPFDVEVALRHGGFDYPKGEKRYKESLLLRQWDARQFTGKVTLIFAWVVDRRVVFLVQKPLLPVDTQWFLESQRWSMSGAETGGSPIAMLVGPDGFLRLNPTFSEPAVEAAYRRLAAGDEAGFKQVLTASPQMALARAYNRATLLHFAALLNRPWAVDLLLAAKSERSPVDDEGNTPLGQAAAMGRTAVVTRLLAGRIDKNAGWPLHQAIRDGHDDVARLLVDAGADLAAENERNELPLGLAIDNNRPAMAELLLKHGADFRFDHEQMKRVLLSKCRQGQTALVRLLLARGAGPEVSVKGLTPLIAAALGGNRELCELLLKAGARPDEAGLDGLTPYLAAASGGHLEAMSLLCGEKADPKAHTGAGVTAAHFAARAGGVAALEFALDHGADRDARDRAGNTPLAYALLSNSLETARLLISRGAALDPHAASFMAQLDAVLRFDLADGLAPLVHTGWLPDHPFAGRWPVLQVAEIYEAKACLEVLRAVAPADQRVSFVSLEKKSALSEPPHLTRAPRPSDPRPEEEEAPPADVEVEVVVDQSGEVVFPRILSTPDPRLVPAAIEELNRLRFSPPKKEGQPVATRLRATLPFSNQHWEIYDSKAVDELPQLKKSVVPHYPEFLRRGGGSGTVELEFVVDTEGRVRDIMVKRTAHPAFAEAATDAIRQWVFTPGRMNGRAVNIRMAITIPFVLQN